MHARRVNPLAQALAAAGSRRGVLSGLFIGTVGLLGWADTPEAAAKSCKKIKDKKKRKKCLQKAQGTTAPLPAPVPAPSPVATGPAEPAGPGDGG